MGDPTPVETVAGLPLLVVPDLCQGTRVGRWIAAARDERGHPADGMRATAVAGGHQQLGVGTHERHGHGDGTTVGQQEVGATRAEGLHGGEHVVPSTGVQAGGMFPQFVEDLLYLESRRKSLDENGRPDRPTGEPEGILGHGEHVVPQPGLMVPFQFGQVEVWPDAGRDQRVGVAEDIHPEIEQSTADGCAVNQNMAFGQMPATWTHHKRRKPLA